MSISFASFTSIIFCILLILVLISGELIVLRHPPSSKNQQMDLTCIASGENDALVWNYNPKEDEHNNAKYDLTYFQPKISTPTNITECAVWKSTRCIAKWEPMTGWKPVNSAERRTAPVLDFRWEGEEIGPKISRGFKEFVIKSNPMKEEYVGKVNGSSDTLVFSVRALQDLSIFLCDQSKKPNEERCYYATLGKANGPRSSSAIGWCEKRGSRDHKNCTDVAEVEHEGPSIIDPYEWRTFRLSWDKQNGTIEVYKGYDMEPFIIGNITNWHSVPHMSVRGRSRSHIRFHHYDYLLTVQPDMELSTQEMSLEDKFCVKLFVGLCPECKLKFRLLNEEQENTATWSISGNSSSIHKGLLVWQPITLQSKISVNFNQPRGKLVIENILNNRVAKGWWAINNFRICQSDGFSYNRRPCASNFELLYFVGDRRESKITIDLIEFGSRLSRPQVWCQKLSYHKSVKVDGFSTMKYNDISQLDEFLGRRTEPCKKACATFGKEWFICDQTGCTCDRGYEGKNCKRECKNEHYGYSCTEVCEFCNNNSCNKTTGYCLAGCKNVEFLPPMCRIEIIRRKPTVTNITDTTAVIFQKLETKENFDGSVLFNLTSLNYSNPMTVAKTLQGYKKLVTNLEPNRRYTINAILNVQFGSDSIKTIIGKSKVFVTTCKGKPLLEITPKNSSVTVTKPQRDETCEDFPNVEYLITINDEESDQTKCTFKNPAFPCDCLNLVPNTEYTVIASELDETIFSVNFKTLHLTLETPHISSLTSEGHGIVRLSWTYPTSTDTNVERFRICIEFLNTTLLSILNVETLQSIYYRIPKKQKEYSYDLQLLTSSFYNVSIAAIDEYNSTSLRSAKQIKIPGDVGFANGEELRVKQSGGMIELEAPTVVNATINTTISIIVREIATCAENRTSSSPADIREWTAFVHMEDQRRPKSWLIDVKQNRNLIVSNCTVHFEGPYIIVVNVKDFYSDSSVSLTSKPITLQKERANLTWQIILPIMAVCLLLLPCIWYWMKRKSEVGFTVDHDIIILSTTMTSTGSSVVQSSLYLARPLVDEKENRVRESTRKSDPDVVSCNPHSCSVEVEEFEEYVKEAMASGLLNSQYAVLPAGPTKQSDYGKLPENLAKNRYKNLIPYDDTRVILNKISRDPYSDYINASYVKGYNKERAYIATQGPMPHTIKDFWRMIWEKQVWIICMLTNVAESTKRKCEQYWPGVGTKVKYGDILISNTDHQVFADYTVRIFNVCYGNENRTVTHLHYTGWPDHGIPMYSQSLVAYLKKLLATPTGKGPVVVHCSAGIGRTGTIILCDICLRRAIRERIFDVPAVIFRMREDRGNLVENSQQYLLAHLIIVESMVSEQTQIPCTHGFPKKIKKLKKKLPSDIQRLKDIVWQDRVLHSLAENRNSDLEGAARNRRSEFVPANSITPEFQRDSTFVSESNYINAVSVDGVKMKKQCLVSQLPTTTTLSEYWRLIAEKKIELILVLQRPDPDNPKCLNIVSKDTIFDPVPYIRVKSISLAEQEHFTSRKLSMIDKSERRTRQQFVTVLTCTGWEPGINGKPPDAVALVSLWEASEKISRKKAPTLILCHNGVTGCGLYLALSFLLEKMALERECDVISAVRAVRRSRTEFVQSLEQFEYLYDAALNYAEFLQTYANFS